MRKLVNVFYLLLKIGVVDFFSQLLGVQKFFQCNWLQGVSPYLPKRYNFSILKCQASFPEQNAWLACAVLLWHQHRGIPEGMDWTPLINPKQQQPLWSQFSFAQKYGQKEQNFLLPFLWPLVPYLSPATKLKWSFTLCMKCALTTQHWSASRELLVLTLKMPLNHHAVKGNWGNK